MKHALIAVLLGLSAWHGHAAPACPPAPAPISAVEGQAWLKAGQERGMLWKLSRQGSHSYLYASIHVGLREWVMPGPRVRQALADTDAIALELDLSDPATLRAITAPPRHAEPLTLKPQQQARLDTQAQAACLPPKALAALHPILQLSQYMVLAGRADGFEPSYGQEMTLMGWAQARGTPIHGLEQAEHQLRALIPAAAAEAAITLEQGLDMLETGQVRPMLKRLASAWAAGDLDTLARYEAWCDCIKTEQDRADFKRLNDDRNPYLAQRISALHGPTQRVFAAVGALHMTGPAALPLLLAREGFEVQQVWPLPSPQL